MAPEQRVARTRKVTDGAIKKYGLKVIEQYILRKLASNLNPCILRDFFYLP